MKKRYQEWIEEFSMCFKSMMGEEFEEERREKNRNMFYKKKSPRRRRENPSEM